MAGAAVHARQSARGRLVPVTLRIPASLLEHYIRQAERTSIPYTVLMRAALVRDAKIRDDESDRTAG